MAADGEKDAVELALLQGEDPDAFDYSGCSALHVAAVHQQEDIVDLLYRAGAAVDSRDKNVCVAGVGGMRWETYLIIYWTTSYS